LVKNSSTLMSSGALGIIDCHIFSPWYYSNNKIYFKNKIRSYR
jgi:hypothetical protein